MSKIEDHAELLLQAAANLRNEVKRKDWASARICASNVSKHRSIILAIIEAVEELQPKSQPQPIPRRKYREGMKRTGDLSRYIREQIAGMQVGDQRIVPPQGEFTSERLRNTVASIAGREWGYGNYVTAWRQDGVEVMRIE